MKRLLSLLLFCNITISFLLAQPVHQVKGTVIDKSSRQPLEFINVMIVGLNKGGVTNAEGKFSIGQVPPGIYRLQASAIRYKTVTTPEYILSTRDLHIQIEMEENQTELEGVTVTASPFRRDIESPVSLRIIGLQEIEKSPGANRDISRIVQSYPGVAFSPIGYRNDLIVRGGSPSENRFYLDGVEIPNINHFSTQGASGGPVGILNADLIREVNFYTGAFPTDKGNALSSVLDFKLRDGDMERNSLKATLGASEVSLASNGHLGKKTSYLVSVRQSYLQFLFDMLGLPFLPTFTDAQFKLKTRFDARNELTVLGLGGIDKMKLNTKADDEDNEYILSYLPKIQQETFTLGAVYRHYAGAHVQSVVASHSYLNNRNTKYQQNDESDPEHLMLRLRSTEQNTQLRLENSSSFRNWKVTVGTSLDYSQYSNTTFQKVYTDRAQTFDYHTYLGIMRWGLFGTVNYTSIDERFTASLGLRADANNYSAAMKDLSDQLSPRLSLSYQLTEHWSLSGNAGLYYQLPPYTALGFKNNNGLYANKYALRYMQVSQGSVGLNWRKGDTFEVSVEGFYKDYDKIPLSVADGIPLTCKGNDYGVIGNELLTSTAQGRSYGAELLLKWLIAKKLNLASSFTLFKSEYRTDKESEYIASAWDNRFIFNLRGTYNLPRHWSVGMKVSCIGGAPYTPYDADKSSLVTAWNAQGKPYYDYTRYNEERLPAFTQVDIRIDKTFYLKRCMLGFYIDLQNIAGSKLKQADVLMSTGVIKNPDAPIAEQRYVMKSLKQESGTLLPTLGITFEY
ncbi:TonB-dependent receptor [Bacteroides thetaiotaomicron]|jgi:ferric aerobactin receptor|uniref:TonB-dependent receptor n=1 Tax=Bacteroides thetaiotaomicron TaxID=818 RepID=UPI0008A09428|nr:TonB-dependent receptor [Bacteroides thetaiotaomicron]MBL3918146.1 TonB-dependent receptor [Bacteroides thetaiotaomicron]MBL3933399.1 TonB-dependent receptor [Bacteroides thetaiotaomicron]MBL3942353.1 TonB-dependent receptor [Bacteroides thetaiotaomicron]MBL3947142.1 TonB-dependent receptor [Bacteroides thetaiotaomicron]MBL3957410.1 TonB-dependent receptor [Bacteroides thetaiotaomicron]